ncbi:hypothetical protein AL538_13940 [Vibrio harveyi]|uniref:Uncharacterized protein n=1 Tax=Vibrio harveyi TaxID=669 RepID=A0ABN4L321_VIBHA|nr:hypothetical protein [Vibrio harveyi]AMF98734.1 hypothetical protein AL538_13940 [Vibrio harveyi]
MPDSKKCYDEMRKRQNNGVVSRKAIIEEVLSNLDCGSFDSFTALTDTIAEKITELEGRPMSGSTIRRKGSKYRSLVESYYLTEERERRKIQSNESRLQEELMLAQLELSKLQSNLKSARLALQHANSEMDRLRLQGIESRTDLSSEKEYSDKEVAAYQTITELVKACEDSGLVNDGYQITSLGFQGAKVLIGKDKCPAFFKWYREQLIG